MCPLSVFFAGTPFRARSAGSRFGTTAMVAAGAVLLLVGCGSDSTGSEFTNQGVEETNQYENQEQNQEQNQNQGQNQAPNQNGEEPLPPPPEDAPTVISDIDTVVSATTVTAGESVEVECLFLDQHGHTVDVSAQEDPPSQRLLLYPDEGMEQNDNEVIPTKAGDAEVACQSIDLGLTDADPAEIFVEPADVYTVITTLSDHQVTAGEQVSASCEAYDEFGNAVDDAEFGLFADTSSPGIVIDTDALTVSLTTTGLFTFDCHVEGMMESFGDAVEVLPGKPAELFADPIPDQNVYGIGQIITIGTDVRDQFGNPIPHPLLEYDATPAGESFGERRYRFFEDGVYTLSAEVVEDTHNDQTLYEEFEIVVNETGPDINCIAPFDGEMKNHSPGSNIDFEGAVADTHGIGEVRVNDEPVSVDSKGMFTTSIPTRYGINFVDVVAADTHGEENVRTCAFMVSDTWATPEDDFIDDAVSLALFQDAIDDKNYGGPNNIRSLNDLIMTVVNSDGLEQEIKEQVMAGNPYSVDYCDYSVDIEDFYFENWNPHQTAFDLIGGGLELFARINDLAFDVYAYDGAGSILRPDCYLNHSTTVTIEYVEMGATAEMFLSGNTPMMQLDEVLYVESGEVDADGAYGWLASLFQGTVQGIVEDTFEDLISDNFDDLFGGLMSSLDVESLSGQFDVPRLDSEETMGLDFAFQFSTVDASSARALFGLAPKITPGDGAGHGIDSEGIIHPPGQMLMDSSANSAAVGAHIALLNQALHSLWRGGLFHADVGGALGEDIPEGAAVDLETRLPPIAVLHEAEGAELMLGAIDLELVYPGIFDEPVSFSLGVTATTAITLDEQEVNFGNIQMEEFHLSPRNVSINEGTRDVLEDFLGGLFEDIIDQSLNAALPSLPIPTFAIPASMGSYDLTPGDEVGLYNTSMNQTSRHLELHGQFGIE